jgi:hypothetical protein
VCLPRSSFCCAPCAAVPCGRVACRRVCHCADRVVLRCGCCVPGAPRCLRHVPDGRSSGCPWGVGQSDPCCVRCVVHRAVADLRSAADAPRLDVRHSCAHHCPVVRVGPCSVDLRQRCCVRYAAHRAVAGLRSAADDRHLDGRCSCALHYPVVWAGRYRVVLRLCCGVRRCQVDQRGRRENVDLRHCDRCHERWCVRLPHPGARGGDVDRHCRRCRGGGHPDSRRVRPPGDVCQRVTSGGDRVRSLNAHRAWGLFCRLSCCGQYGRSWVVG